MARRGERRSSPRKTTPPKPPPPPPQLLPCGVAFSLGACQNAVLLVDKPQEWTSFDVCHKLRNSLTIRGQGLAGVKVGVSQHGCLHQCADFQVPMTVMGTTCIFYLVGTQISMAGA